jgi:CHAT domain-containing protein
MKSAKLPIACLALLSLALAVVWRYLQRPVAFEKVIALGNRLEDRLPRSDETSGGLVKASESRWLFNGRKGERVRLEGESYEFGVSMRLLDPMNRQIAMGDHNRGFFNAGIITILPVTGKYTMIVGGSNADQMGTYWLSLQEGDSEVDWSQSAAESFYRRGIQWAEESGSTRAACWLNLGMGLFLRQRGDRNEAERYYSEGLRFCNEKSDFTYGRWAIAIERGRLFKRLRSFDRALEEFQLALEMSKELRSPQEAEALVLIELGSLYNSMARVDLANIYFRNAMHQAEECGNPMTLVKLYTSLNAVPELNDRDKAIEYAEKGFSLCSGLDPEIELQAMHALAGAYLFLATGRTEEGLAVAGQMRLRAREIGCVDEEIAALTLMSMGNYRARDTNAMIECARDAFALTSVTDEDPGPRRIALQLLADGEMERGNHQIALDWCLKALQTVEGNWQKENIEDLRRELLSQSKAICTQIIMNLGALNSLHPSPEYARQAFDYAERSRSRSLLEQLLPGRKTYIVDPQVLRRDQELTDRLSAVRGQLALLHASSEASRDKLHRLQEERARLLGEHMRRQAEVRSLSVNAYRTANLSSLTAEKVRKKLFETHPKTVVLCYQLGIRKSFLIVLTRDSCRLFELADLKQISKAITEWRLLISSQQKPWQDGASDSHRLDEIAYNLYNILVKPAADIIEGRDLIVVPSDAVSTLAFEALVIRDPSEPQHSSGPKYLVQQHAITYAPSLSVLVEIESKRRQTRSRRRRMLLIGDPSVDGSDTRIAGSGDQSFVAKFDGIPAARKEIVDITRIARQKGFAVTSWLGSEASEARLKRSNLSGVQFLHIATHGIVDPQDGAASALTLFGDPDGSQDGILTCDEIAGLKLNADLVVLSGCWTSSGQAAGAEGVVGLNRTFLLAGARSVCGSLWQAEDVWTQRLMSRFYTRLLSDRLSKSQALRFAKLDLIRDGANPSQWAPFVLEGSLR